MVKKIQCDIGTSVKLVVKEMGGMLQEAGN